MSSTAHREEKQLISQSGGLESLVDGTAYVLAILQALGAVLLFVATRGEGWGPAIALCFGAFVQWLLLRCLAEILRLQKKQAGLDYEGKITGPTWTTIYCCSLCKNMLHSEHRCDMCGAKIVADGDASVSSSESHGED